MHLPETGWKLAHYVAISKNTGVIPSLSGEAISEMSQIREKFEMTKLLIEEVSRHQQK